MISLKNFLSSFLICLSFLAVAQKSAIAQGDNSDPKAKAILDRMKAKLNGYKTMSMEFKLTLEMGADKDVQQGKAYMSGKKYRMEMPNQDVICDGAYLWIVDKKNNQAQKNNVDSESENFYSPSNIIKIYENNQVIYAVVGEATEAGKPCTLIEFKPTDRDADYSKIRLSVDKSTDMVVRAIVFGKDGMRYTFDVLKLTPNAPVGDAQFIFDAKNFKGEIIDVTTD